MSTINRTPQVNKNIFFMLIWIPITLGVILMSCVNKTMLTNNDLTEANYSYLVYGTQEFNGIRVFNFKTNEYLNLIMPRKNAGISMVYPKKLSKKADTIAYIQNDIVHENNSKLMLYDFNTGETNELCRTPTNSIIHKFAISDTGEQLMFITLRDGILYHYDMPSRKIKKISKTTSLVDLYFSAESFNLVDFEGSSTVEYSKYGIFRRQYPAIIIAKSDDERVKLIFNKIKQEKYLDSTEIGKKIIYGAHSVYLSPDGRFLVYDNFPGKHKDTLIIREVKTGKKLTLDLQGHIGPIKGVTLL